MAAQAESEATELNAQAEDLANRAAIQRAEADRLARQASDQRQQNTQKRPNGNVNSPHKPKPKPQNTADWPTNKAKATGKPATLSTTNRGSSLESTTKRDRRSRRPSI